MSAGWETKKLGEVYDVRDGTHDSPKYQEEGYPLITSKNLKNDSLDFSNVKYISKKDFDKINERSKVDPNDILFAMIGTIGNPIVVDSKKEFAIKNVALFKVPENQNSFFLKYYLESNYVVEKMAKEAKGTTQKFVGLGYLRNFEIKLPPIEEQRRIVAVLDEALAGVETAIDNTERNLENGRELLDSCLQSVFTNPHASWKEKPLGELCSKITKGSSPKWQGVRYIDTPGILFVTSQNVGRNQILLDEKKYVEEKFNDIESKSILKKGDVLTNIVGASIGRTAIFSLDENANINQAVCILRCKPETLYNQYLSHLLNSPFFRDILHDNEVNNARANLSLTFFRNLSIPLPPVDEQRAVVAQLDDLASQTQQLETITQQKLAALTELKQSILQQAFSGALSMS